VAPETPNQKVFSLVKEGRVEDAARLAARFINAGDDEGFFIYGETPAHRKAEEWFNDQVAAARRYQVTVTGHKVSPELAQVLLQNNEGNRRVDAANLATIMRDIIEDRWDLNGETIKISKEGLLNDAQHRNFGVLLTGFSIRSDIRFGLTRESRSTVDIGHKRKVADRAAMRGEPDYVVVSSSARLAFELDNKRAGGDTEIDNYLVEHTAEIRAAVKAKGSNIRGIGPSSMTVAAIVLLRLGAKAERIHEFFDVVRKNELTKNGNAARTLHQAIYPKNPDKDPPLRLSRSDWVSTLAHHFINWNRNKRVHEPLVGLPLPEAI